MRTRHFLTLLISLASLMALRPAAAEPPPRYAVTIIKLDAVPDSSVTGPGLFLDDQGVVAVRARTLDGRPLLFRWRNGRTDVLKTLPASLRPTATQSADVGANAVAGGRNTAGQIVGWVQDPKGRPVKAMLWQDGQPTVLSERIPLGTSWDLRQAVAVNNKGQIAGFGYVGLTTLRRPAIFLLSPVVFPHVQP